MRKNPFSEKKWYPMAVAICIGILFYYILEHLGTIWSIIDNIAYFIYPIAVGAIIAYLINPLMRLLEGKVFKKIKKQKVKSTLSLVLSLIIVLGFLTFIIGTLVPQLYDSIITLYGNKDDYIDALSDWISRMGGDNVLKFFEGFFQTSRNLIEYVSKYISENSEELAEGAAALGGHIGSWLIGFIFSIYFLAEKEKIALWSVSLLKSIQKNPKKTERTLVHIRKIDSIITKYLMFSIIDGIIIGIINAVFMSILGMEYSGLVSVIVGVTNLVPTFGPIIGGVIGAVILLLTNPMHALYFLIFTLVLQTFDGYILKPKMFGDTFGISGLWILIAIIVGGRIFGILGIVLAIPCVAVGDYLIRDVYLSAHSHKTEDEAWKDEKSKGDNE